ncbi:MAG: SpoIIE family protein phosphatase [Pseudomonadota bacterium]
MAQEDPPTRLKPSSIKPVEASDSSLEQAYNHRPIVALTQKTHRFAQVFTAVFTILGLLLTRSEWGQLLSDRVSSPVEYRVRHWLGRDVKISPKLKIILYDDKVAARLNKPSLSLLEWARVLEYISLHQPERIYIDQIFGVGFGSSLEDKLAIERISKIKTPISVGALISKNQIAYRSELPNSSPFIVGGTENSKTTGLSVLEELPDLKKLKYYAYGPTYQMLPLFSVGHIFYESERFITPLFRNGESSMLPHLALMGQKTTFDGEHLKINDSVVPMYRGRTSINVGKYPEDFLNITRSLNGILTRIEETPPQKWEDFLSPGDSVLLIPEGFTGSADFKPGPFGSMFGGWIIGSVLNSVLTGEWLNVVHAPYLLIAAVAATGFLCAWAPTWIAWLGLGVLMVVFPIAGLALFSYGSIIINWLPITISCAFLGMAVLATRSRVEKEKDAFTRQVILEAKFIAKENALLDLNQKILLKEKEEASIIAQAFQPDSPPLWPKFEISAFHRCLDGASGDWYFFEHSKDHSLLHVVLCDITGHGVQAALIVSACKTVLNSFKKYRNDALEDPTFCLQYLDTLNDILYKQGLGRHTCTMIGVTFQVPSHQLHLVSCSHPSALYHPTEKRNERPLQLRTHFNPVGYSPVLPAKLKIYPWFPGDLLTIHSDGIPITDNLRLYRSFIDSYQGEWSDAASKLYEHIWGKIEATTGKKADDDVSLVLIRMKPNP